MVGVQYKGKKELFRAAVKVNIKKLHRRESNPGRKRERLECYQLHHNGFLIYGRGAKHNTTGQGGRHKGRVEALMDGVEAISLRVVK